MNTNGIEIRIKGKVQGVGFRPYVWLLANAIGLRGNVSNDGAGVIVRVWHNEKKLAHFLEQLPLQCPPLASIQSVTTLAYHWENEPADFTIEHSGEGKMDTQIVPDAATCPACLSDIKDRNNRRYHYPFTNCTHCGPRFTIIEKIPYDRIHTSMKAFPMCPACLQEYQNPADRRFHAQPNACPICGPQISVCTQNGSTLTQGDQAVDIACETLAKGHIVAVKGLGGFHLAVDALNQEAVTRLRERKHRPDKPLAIMLPGDPWLEKCVATSAITNTPEDLLKKTPIKSANGMKDEAHGAQKTRHIIEIGEFSSTSQQSISPVQPLNQCFLKLLKSPAAPIVLAQKNASSPICEAVAPQLNEIGVMLPANPLQHLLLERYGKPLVMTSGNAHGKPPALSHEAALHDLKDIADLWLTHNRDIVQRADDSVVRFKNRQPEILRRARGYVPDPIELPEGFQNSPAVLAIGGDLKNTFCFLRGSHAILSQHLGDLADIDIQQQLKSAIALFQNVYQFSPEAIAVDAHPGYISRRIGIDMANRLSIPAHEVFHHHAHIASCMAEHGHARNAGPVIGLALDGIGYGNDHTFWGGECLKADYQTCEKIGGLPAVALPGADLAAKQPWRNLFAQLEQFVPGWQTLPEAKHIPTNQINLLRQAIARQINSPKASSTGRLFDAVAAALGICADRITWEGQAACQLEALAQSCSPFNAPIQMPIQNNTLELATFWQTWLPWQASPEQKAYAFHDALAKAFAQLALQAAKQNNIKTIVLSGGVIHNALLRQMLLKELSTYTVWLPTRLPAGDGGIAFGQALIAAAHL